MRGAGQGEPVTSQNHVVMYISIRIVGCGAIDLRYRTLRLVRTRVRPRCHDMVLPLVEGRPHRLAGDRVPGGDGTWRRG